MSEKASNAWRLGFLVRSKTSNAWRLGFASLPVWLSEGAREVQAAIVPRCGGAFGGGPQSGGGPKTTVQFGPEVGQQALTDAAGNVKQGAHEAAPRIPQRIWGACDIHVRNPGDA